MTLSPPPANASKEVWRAWARGVRAGLPDQSARVCAGLAAFLHDRGLRRVLAYRALPGEPHLGALAQDFELFTTRAWWRERRLSLHAWETASELSRFGALEPPRDAPQVAREGIEAVLLPGLAFDAAGRRLGYGGGFYDRLLDGWNVPVIGVTWEALIVPALPHEPHDQRAGFLATEAGVREAARTP